MMRKAVLFSFILFSTAHHGLAYHGKRNKGASSKQQTIRDLLRKSADTCSQNGIVYGSTQGRAQAAVTYELNGGRLGNNMLTYMHAKWISQHFDIPLLYRPFLYSDQLTMHTIESNCNTTQFQKTVVFQSGDIINIDRNSSTLYVVRYFPENIAEIEHPSGSLYFAVPWDDAEFKQELRKCIAPSSLHQALL